MHPGFAVALPAGTPATRPCVVPCVDLCIDLCMVLCAVLGALHGAGCSPSDTGACSGPADCAAPTAPACELCPPVAAELCLAGACTARAPDTVDVTATFLVDRAIEASVRGLAWALVAGDRSCDAVGPLQAFPDGLNALAAGQKTLTGGGFHPDLALGRVPEGPILLLALATDAPAARGAVLGSGCVAAEAGAPTLAMDRLDLAPAAAR